MIRLAFRVRREDAEIVLAELMELAPTGVEETDLGDTIEYAVYGAEGELPDLPAVRALVGDALVEVVSTEVADDWADRWRAFHEPILIKGRLYVRPPWCAPYAGGSAAGAVSDLVVDPGRAFGTGAHATTRLCLELLVELTDRVRAAAAGGPTADVGTHATPATTEDADPGAGHAHLLGPVLDLGSGSGVLAVAAGQLGWGPVHGVDHEEASVAATLENAAANGVSLTAERFDLLRDGATGMPGVADPATTDPAPPLVLANLLRPLLLRVAADGFVGPTPHHLIASGLLVHECDGVAAAFERTGLVEAERRSHGDWAALLLRRA